MRNRVAPRKWEGTVCEASTVADRSNGTPEDQATYSWTVNIDISLGKKEGVKRLLGSEIGSFTNGFLPWAFSQKLTIKDPW